MHLEPCVFFRLSLREPLGGKIHSTDVSVPPQYLEGEAAADRLLNETIKPMLTALLNAYNKEPQL